MWVDKSDTYLLRPTACEALFQTLPMYFSFIFLGNSANDAHNTHLQIGDDYTS